MFFEAKKFILTIIGATALSGFSLASILFYTDPENSGYLIILSLYISIFLFSTGLLTLLGVTFRKFASKGIFSVNLSNSLRQALLLSIFLIICLTLSAHGLLFWWVMLSVFLPFVILEIFLNLKI